MRFSTLAIPALVCGLSVFASAADVIPEGTRLDIRVDQRIRTGSSDGRVFTGTVANDVLDRNGNAIIYRGSTAELIARRVGDREVSMDLDSITIRGRRYSVDASTSVSGQGRKDGLGANGRTGKFVGGGAVLGTILGAIAGGGRGAAIGAAAGAGAGAGTQVLTRGRSVDIPAESVLSFRLDRELVIRQQDNGRTRNGYHYHNR